MDSLLLLMISTFISALGTVAGFGGGVFLIPIMIVFFKIPIENAAGVAAVSLVPASLISTINNFKLKRIDFKLALSLQAPAMIAAYVGARLTDVLPTKFLELLLAIVLTLLAIKIIFFGQAVKKISTSKSHNSGFYLQTSFGTINIFAMLALGLTAGLTGGLFGIGGGIIITPVLISLFGIPSQIAVATSLLMVLITCIVSGSTHLWLNHVLWHELWPCGLGFSLGAIIGGRLNLNFSEKNLRIIIGVSLILVSVVLASHSMV